MAATVNFEAPQIKVDNGTMGIEISQVIIPYSIHNTEDTSQYLGGQTILTKEDSVSLTDNTYDWYKKALVKIKDLVAASEFDVPEPSSETPYDAPEQPNTDE
ncbi:hypothetical protein WC29P3_00013 [Weissella phage WC29P3]|nr:hypothetical protein WC29P3_00013 [Weissella phage WC29P3]